jgi:phthiodiolone/phenolphthiodiolone dimycocerosates ketoreductase
MRSNHHRVKVGCYIDPITPIWLTSAGIAIARLLGADDIWIGDHAKSMFPSAAWRPEMSPMARFVPSLDAYLDPTVVIARGTGRFGVPMGTAVTDSIRRTPADLARVWMSLHHLSRGRVVLGIGSGEHENTVPFGLALEPRVARLEDTLVAIRAAWASSGEPLSHEGKFHRWHDATFGLPGRKGTTPPIWVAAQGPRACRLAGRHGDGWIFILNGALDAWHEAAVNVANGARAAGRDPETLTRSVFVAPMLASSQRVQDELAQQPMVHAMALTLPGAAWSAAGATHPLGAEFAGFSELDPQAFESERLREYGRHITADLLRHLMPFGTASEVADTLRPIIDAGVNHVIIYSAANALKPSLAAGSMVEQRRLIKLLKKMTPGRLAAHATSGEEPTRAGSAH